MDVLIDVVLPLSLAIIMFSLGIGLTVKDFARVLHQPLAFVIGAVSQVVMLPLLAYALLVAFSIDGALAVGVMLLALCPGGVTSNIITKLARGDVALSVSLTAVISLAGILSMPLLAAWSVDRFMGTQAPPVSVTSLALAVFLITTLPVALGVLARHVVPGLANTVDRPLSMLATTLFVIIVAAALAANWAIFAENVLRIGQVLVCLNLLLLILGLGLATLAGLGWPQRKTISIETGIQNATLGITLGALISGTQGFAEMAIPSAVYGITMYLVAAPFVAWYRSR